MSGRHFPRTVAPLGLFSHANGPCRPAGCVNHWALLACACFLLASRWALFGRCTVLQSGLECARLRCFWHDR
eukprot:844416-Amphidinium_carterae.2